jgi:hypothetical protein
MVFQLVGKVWNSFEEIDQAWSCMNASKNSLI